MGVLLEEDFKKRAVTSIELRKKSLDTLAELRSLRKDLSKEYRGLKEIKKVKDEKFLSSFNRSVITVLSSDSPKDLAFIGRSIWRDVVSMAETALPAKAKDEFNAFTSIYLKTWEAAVSAFSSSEDFTLFLDVAGQFEDILIGLEEASKSNLNESQVLLSANVKNSILIVSLIILLTLFVNMIITKFVMSRIQKNINSSTGKIKNMIEELKGTTLKVNDISIGLSEASNEQSSAVEKTLTAVTQINSMAHKSRETASAAKNQCADVSRKAEEAAILISEMDGSSAAINKSIDQVREAFNQSLAKFDEIRSIIGEINEKTMVISDIVFQTKLLSFNASVEAARAGEAGKGFAVVSEEIGNLAQVSGKANEEIRSLLQKSLKDVDSISEEVRTRVHIAIDSCVQESEKGRGLSQSANVQVTEVSQFVTGLLDSISSIETAISEQAIGLDEIAKAVSEITSLTEQNLNRAILGREQSGELNEHVREADQASEDVQAYVGIGR